MPSLPAGPSVPREQTTRLSESGSLLLEALLALFVLTVGGMGSLALILLAVRSLSETEVRAKVLPEAMAWLRTAPGDSEAHLDVEGGVLWWTPDPTQNLLEFHVLGDPGQGWPILWNNEGAP